MRLVCYFCNLCDIMTFYIGALPILVLIFIFSVVSFLLFLEYSVSQLIVLRLNC